MSSGFRYVFGPVPSRRLGRSLGINNIPPKNCTYSCVYCQLGRTRNLTVERRRFTDPELILDEVSRVVERVGEGNIDYVTFVPDGEPTLDLNLGRIVSGLRETTSVKLAILTNSSLMYRPDVREDLMKFDLVSIKVDSVDGEVYRRVNRPHPSIELDAVLDGIRRFTAEYEGTVISETMLIDGLNDNPDSVEGVAEFLAEIEVDKAFISIPTRPPAEAWVKAASEQRVVEAYEVFRERLGEGRVETLIGYEGSEFALASGDVRRDVLGITAVHPMRLDYFREVVSRGGVNPDKLMSELLRGGLVRVVEYRGHKFLIRRFRK